MKLCYAIQPAFYDIMKQSGNIQALLEGMDEQQRSRIQIPIEMQSLQESAEAFFQKEIECRKDCLSYDHFLKSRGISIPSIMWLPISLFAASAMEEAVE